MNAFLNELRDLHVGKVKENEPLANHTTIKIGGPAEIFIEPSSIENLQKTMEVICKNNVKWRAIGRGSNLLVSDQGIEGAVIKLGSGLDHIEITGTKVLAGGGVSLISLAAMISKKGLSGFEFAGGIPGSVGGAVLYECRSTWQRHIENIIQGPYSYSLMVPWNGFLMRK